MSTSTNPPSAHSLPPLTLIVASTPSLGIGHQASLPWPTLKADLQFFARVTKRPPPASPTSETPTHQSNDSKTSSLRNAVVMGRKTFDSIPSKFRPLKDRINVVITRSPGSTSLAPYHENKDVIIAASIVDGLQQLREQHEDLGRVFVIGGAEIYKQAIGLQECNRVLWTRLSGEWDCDTWFPEGIVGDGVEEGSGRENGWKRRTGGELEDWVQEEGVGGLRKEGDVEFEVSMWERGQ
ncbi:MAG: hypothetical protein L6R38_009040 [Xanthoria sp. 2 TBL-2021]|nr:MAG: hypothetical protein L6R38_009040 [Xanthoria sp. 2 TBL-2021]